MIMHLHVINKLQFVHTSQQENAQLFCILITHPDR